MEIENKKMKSHNDIEKMKKYIEGQEELAELVEQFGEDGVEDNLIEGEEASMGTLKPRKTKMCKEFMETGKCKSGKVWGKEMKCKFAHNPIQLGLVPITKKIQNLRGVVSAQSRLLH